MRKNHGFRRQVVGRRTYLEQFRWRMPNLSTWPFIVRPIHRIPPGDLILKLHRVAHDTEVDGVPRGRKDSRLLGEIAIVGVIERVLDKVAHEHFDARGRFGVALKVVGRDAGICDVLWIGGLIEEYLLVVIEAVFWRFPSFGRGRSRSE